MLDSFADMRFESSGATQVDTYPSACTSTSTGNNSNTNSISNCSSLNSSVSRPLPKTFTRLARGLPTNSTNDFLSNTTLFQPFPPAHSKPTEADSVARKDPDQSENISTRANNDTGANATSTFRDDSASSNSFTDNSKSSYHTKANTHGLQRFRPTLPSLDSQGSAFLGNLTLSQDDKAIRPCPTFTRISKLPNTNPHNDTSSSRGNCTSYTSCSSGYSGDIATKPHGLSLSLSLSPPSSAVPSLCSASSSCSSSSSPSSLSSSSSPPTRFYFPTAERKDWWMGDPTMTETPFLGKVKDERAGFGCDGYGEGAGQLRSGCYRLPSLSRADVMEASQPLAWTVTDSCLPLFPHQEQFMDDAAPSLDKRQEGKETEPCRPGVCALPYTSRQRFQQIRANTLPSTAKSTHFPNRARVPSPPPVLTGFCSINNNPIKCSGEPSPQDFLGEADLPYPLPSTLQERQARQRKRAEQLRQLKIREEREARENLRRRIPRRRGASFSVDMFSSSCHSSQPSTAGPLSRSLSGTLPSAWSSSTPSKINGHRSAYPEHHLKRSPSSPAKTTSSIGYPSGPCTHRGSGNAGSKNSGARRLRLCVGFDMRRTKVFEYDVDEGQTPYSAPSSPTLSSDGETKGYFNHCL